MYTSDFDAMKGVVLSLPFNASRWSRFGFGLAVCGSVLLVGAPGGSVVPGAVYIYRYGALGWTTNAGGTATTSGSTATAGVTANATLVPDGGVVAGTRYGAAVALHGPWAAVGAPHASQFSGK